VENGKDRGIVGGNVSDLEGRPSTLCLHSDERKKERKGKGTFFPTIVNAHFPGQRGGEEA